MAALNKLRTGRPRLARTTSRPEIPRRPGARALLSWHSGRLLAVATVSATSALALVGPVPASAGTISAVTRSSSAAGDVLFWSRSTAATPPPGQPVASGYSIVKASAAAPTLIATVLASPVSPASPADFSGPEVSPDGTKLAYIKNSSRPTTSLEVRDLATGSTTVLAAETSNDLTEFKLSEPTWSPNGATIAYVDTSEPR